MEDLNKHSNDQQKRKEKLLEYNLEEGEICIFPKSRFLHNKIIIADDNNKERNIKETNNYLSRINEDSIKIENVEIKENEDKQIFNDEKHRNNEILKIIDIKEHLNPNLLLDASETTSNAHIDSAAAKNASYEAINKKHVQEKYLEDDVDKQKGCLSERKSEDEEIHVEREKEEMRNSAIFTIPMDLDRESDNNADSNQNTSEERKSETCNIKKEEDLLTEKKEEYKLGNEIDTPYSSAPIKEKSSQNLVKTGMLTEDQILENKEILNNKNFLINNDSPNLVDVKKNYIKIKILDDDKIEEKDQIEKDPNTLKYLQSLKSEMMDLNSKEGIINNPIVEPQENIKNIGLVEEKKILLESTPEKKQYVIQNTENTNITYNQINIADKKSNSAKDNYESDRDIISNLISYKNPVLLKSNSNKNPTNSTEKINSNNSANSKDESNNFKNIIIYNNINNNTQKQTNMPTNLKQDLNKEKQHNEELTSENHEEKNDLNASKDKNNQTKDKEKDKKLYKKCEKKVNSKNCIYCKVEITYASSILKFKSSDDFLTYCKLFFEKLQPQKKEVYVKSIASFEKYYTEKYSNFEQINNIIFKSVKSICKVCFEENIKEENGFINILAALNYNIIINNKKTTQTNSQNNTNNNLPTNCNNTNIKKESNSLELNEDTNNDSVKPNTLETAKTVVYENNQDLISAASKNIKSDVKGFDIESSQISVENFPMKNTTNVKRDIISDFDKQMGIKKNSNNLELKIANTEKANSYPSNLKSPIKISNDSSIFIPNNDLLGRKINRSEQELLGAIQKKSTFYENKLIPNNSETHEQLAHLNKNSTQSINTLPNANYANIINNPNSIANLSGESLVDESYNKSVAQNKPQNIDTNLVNKNNLNSNLNMNTKNISLENLNITNVYMNFDQKKGLKPILIDSKISNNEHLINNNNKLNVNNNNNLKKQEELIAMTNSNSESNQNLLEDLKKNYIDLNNCSLEKKLFLNSLQKKSQLLINNLSDFEKTKQLGITNELNYINNNNNELEVEKKNFTLNNSKQMGLLMNSINQQLEENKNLIYPSQKMEIKDIPSSTQIGSLLMEQYHQEDKNNQQIHYLNSKNAVGSEYEGFDNNNNNSFGLNNNNNNSSLILNNSHIGNAKTPSAPIRNENINLNSNQDNNQMLSAAHKNLLNSEKENQPKSQNKTNLIDRILNPNKVNSKSVYNSTIKSNTINQNLIDLSGKNSLTITEEASNRINNNINNGLNINEDSNKKIEESLNSNLQQQQNLNPLLNGLLSPPNSNLNNLNRITLHQMLLNQNQQLQNNNNNLQLQGSYLLNNPTAANLEAKKQLSEQAALGNLNLSHQNLLIGQNNQLINQTLSGMVQNPMNWGLVNSPLMPGMQNIPNLQSQLNQHLSNLNPLMQLNPNLLGNLDAQSLLVQNNLLNQNQMDLGILGLNNNPLIQLPLPLSYQLQMQLNPSLGLPLSLPMQIQNQMQLGNLGNMQLGTLNQMELLNKLNVGAPNLQALQQQQQWNILKSNYPQQHLIQAGNPLELSLQQQNLLKGVNNNNTNNNAFQQQRINIEHLRSQEIANTLSQLNQFEKSQIQNQQDQLSSQIEQNRIRTQSGIDLGLKNQEQSRNLLNSNAPNNQLNLNLNQMMIQNGQNNHLLYNQAILNQLNNQNLNYLNSKMHSEE